MSNTTSPSLNFRKAGAPARGKGVTEQYYAKDTRFWFSIKYWPSYLEWTVDVYDLTHGQPGEHAYDIGSCRTFTAQNYDDAMRLANALSNFAASTAATGRVAGTRVREAARDYRAAMRLTGRERDAAVQRAAAEMAAAIEAGYRTAVDRTVREGIDYRADEVCWEPGCHTELGTTAGAVSLDNGDLTAFLCARCADTAERQ